MTNGDERSAASPLVTLRNVGLRYGSGPEVLRGLDLDLAPGSFHFLTGRSGAGKSSLLSLLHLSQRPSRGLMAMFGKDVNEVPRRQVPAMRRRVGVVFQDFRLLDHLSAAENVALPLRLAGRLPAADIRNYVAEMMAWVGLTDKTDARPPTLSGGEKQRVAIARAVIGGPRLLLADEPTGNVDREMGERLMTLFVKLNGLGTTVLIATHDPALPTRFAYPVLRLEDGRLDADQPAAAPA
ncbi:cell division ATP-binding protein FtsE [Minwuia thermotolerans]|uniref:cell division ATP-binding protein FtsE n=1 Tax=Minwuia thermotolerans TaxID=2056226 RepID=UPI0019D140AE|nr:ATP-binding cassette domain-containing protein [Minwuia thermotolerans]